MSWIPIWVRQKQKPTIDVGFRYLEVPSAVEQTFEKLLFFLELFQDTV
jgi:hypothetical protein